MNFDFKFKEVLSDVVSTVEIPKSLVEWRVDVMGEIFRKYFSKDVPMYVIHLN